MDRYDLMRGGWRRLFEPWGHRRHVYKAMVYWSTRAFPGDEWYAWQNVLPSRSNVPLLVPELYS